MPCISCGHENPDGSRFCGECGASLSEVVPCPACGRENPAGQRFCNACGGHLTEPAPVSEPELPEVPEHLAERIVTSARALEGERKQVTVLFVDVQGSMDLAGGVDPEAWRSIMGRFFEQVCEEVHRFEGTVDKFTGDGAMALFGAPIAHEDHAARACYAALHLRDRLHDYAAEVRSEHGLGFSVRMGLNSGEVVVGAVGSELDLEYTAIGNTVGLAARMESLAEPGKPCLTAATAGLVGGLFELEGLGRLHVKGMSEPVEGYALLGTGDARTRLEAAGARGLSPFVGREEEMNALETALAHAAEGGRVVGVVAEPGLGKSRLCREFVERCQERGMEVTEGRGVAHGKRIPLLPVIEMMRSYFGVSDADEPALARQKVAGRLLLLDDDFRAVLPVVFDFLGIPDPTNPPPAELSPEGRQRMLFTAVRRLVAAQAGDGGGLVLVEDLHWLDPGSEAFLQNLVDSLEGSPTLLLLNFRPEYKADWMHKSYYQRLPLLPLSDTAVEELVGDLLGDGPSLDGLAELIAERTGGNPFFIEEVVQGLVESRTLAGSRGDYRLTRSIEGLEIPPTVQAVLAARMDRLPERQKSVLQSASVIGREFAEPVLRRVMGLPEHELSESLSALRAAELVYDKTLYPEAEYAFKHPLTEEVAYRSQLAERRGAIHGAVADALEELYPERLDELAGLVANHREQAHDPLGAARWCVRAATWAGQHHPADALRHWRRVRELLATESVTPSDEARGLALAACVWILQFGWRLGVDEEEAQAVYEEARELAPQDQLSALAAIQGAYGTTLGMVGGVQEALDHAREAARLAEEAGDLELRSVIGTGYWLATAGHQLEALEELDALLDQLGDRYEVGRDVIGFSTVVWMTFFRGQPLLELGRLAEAERAFREGVRLAEEHDDVESLGWAHSNLGSLGYLHGDPSGDYYAHAREGVQVAERIGSSFSRTASYAWLALAHMGREEWQDALGAMGAALEIMEATGTWRQYEAMGLGILAEAHLGAGDRESCAEAAARGAALAAEQGTFLQEASCRTWLGEAMTQLGRLAEARPELERARDLCGETYLYRGAFVHRTLAHLAAAEGDEPARQRELAVARDLFRGMGAEYRERQVADELAVAPAT